MPSPTPTQLTVMEAMRDGAVLHGCFHPQTLMVGYFLSRLGTRESPVTVSEPTFGVLWRERWVKAKDERPNGGGTYTLTPKGLAALAGEGQ